jgi:hypothetical protein
MMTAYRTAYASRLQAPEVSEAVQALQTEGQVLDLGELLPLEEEEEEEEEEEDEEMADARDDVAEAAWGEEGASRGHATDWEATPQTVGAGWLVSPGPSRGAATSLTPVASACQALSRTPAVDQQTWETTTSVDESGGVEIDLEGSISPSF